MYLDWAREEGGKGEGRKRTRDIRGRERGSDGMDRKIWKRKQITETQTKTKTTKGNKGKNIENKIKQNKTRLY